MLFCDIDLLDADFAIKHHQWVGVRDGRIAYIGSVPPAPDEAATFGETYDGTGRLLVPALYNAHAHAPMTLLRGYAENLPLQRWLEEKCFPFEAKMTAEDCYWGTVLACAEMARFGVVSFSDMYYATEERARAVLEAGMKANMCEGLVAFEEKPYAEYPICAQMEALVRDWHGAADGASASITTSIPSICPPRRSAATSWTSCAAPTYACISTCLRPRRKCASAASAMAECRRWPTSTAWGCSTCP